MAGFATRAVRGKLISRGAEELSVRLADQTEQLLDVLVRTRAPAILSDVEVERLLHPELDQRMFAHHLIQRRTRLVVGSGVVSAVPGAWPGLGSATQMGTALFDAGFVIYQQIALILALTHAYGRDLHDYDARRLDVILTLALEAGEAVTHE